jgi:hypothetical protein
MAYGDFAITVGEEVGVVRHNRTYGGILFAKFGTVTKINGHGHIYVQAGDKEYRFTKTGAAYKDYYGPCLTHAASLRAQLAAEQRRKEQVRVAREMEQTLKEGYSYAGRFFVSEERVAALKNLVAEMEQLVDA